MSRDARTSRSRNVASSMADGRIVLPCDCHIPHDLDSPGLARHPGVVIDYRPHAVVELLQSAARPRLCPVQNDPSLIVRNHDFL